MRLLGAVRYSRWTLMGPCRENLLLACQAACWDAEWSRRRVAVYARRTLEWNGCPARGSRGAGLSGGPAIGPPGVCVCPSCSLAGASARCLLRPNLLSIFLMSSQSGLSVRNADCKHALRSSVARAHSCTARTKMRRTHADRLLSRETCTISAHSQMRRFLLSSFLSQHSLLLWQLWRRPAPR